MVAGPHRDGPVPEARGAPGRSLTRLLLSWRHGERQALDMLMERVHPELRRIAARHFRSERSGHTLEPAALVNELYVRLREGVGVDWRDRRHFYAVASGIMRNLLVDHARSRRARKRRRTDVAFPSPAPEGAARAVDVLDLDEALSRLERRHPVPAKVVMLRFFAGLTVEEAAAELGIGRATAERAWAFARAWLFRELGRPGVAGASPRVEPRTGERQGLRRS